MMKHVVICPFDQVAQKEGVYELAFTTALVTTSLLRSVSLLCLCALKIERRKMVVFSHSLHVCHFVASAMQACFAQFTAFQSIFSTGGTVQIDKVDGNYAMLVPWALLGFDWTLTFSSELNGIFGSNTSPHPTIP